MIRILVIVGVTMTLALPVVAANSTKAGPTTKAAPKAGESKVDKREWKENPSGLKWIDHQVGKGEEATKGDSVEVHYTGWLYDNGKHGKQVDSSVGRRPYPFKLGAARVIKGWDEGIVGMKVGGKRELLIPPAMAYGTRGTPGGPIPPNATLNFEVELVKVIKKK